jgi:tRNA U34 5-methylaminomethyl-2-thiouridine-forming methyltransferase MnmC
VSATLLITEDGSHSLLDERTGETYHSIHGAVQESNHIFIERGLLHRACNTQLSTSIPVPTKLKILEVGFGTGLNALLTWLEAESKGIDISYTTVELYPIRKSEWEKLNYTGIAPISQNKDLQQGLPAFKPTTNELKRQQVNAQSLVSFHQLHTSRWGEFHTLSGHFTFRKLQVDFTAYTPDTKYDLIYFDAFSPEKQPELWISKRFEMISRHCNPGAILTTYCAKGIVKQALRSAGFHVERLKGPPGKRHMLRASIL